MSEKLRRIKYWLKAAIEELSFQDYNWVSVDNDNTTWVTASEPGWDTDLWFSGVGDPVRFIGDLPENLRGIPYNELKFRVTDLLALPDEENNIEDLGLEG